MIRSILIVPALMTALAGGAAQAAGVNDTVVEASRVPLTGLDLNTSDGAARALTRIDLAARRGCMAPGAIAFAVQSTPDFQRCHQRAVERAVAELDRPAVSAALASRSEAELRLSRR